MGIRVKSLCRKCINEKYGINLSQKDCIYHTFIQPCAECKEMRHIVVDLRLSAKLKTIFRKKKQ